MAKLTIGKGLEKYQKRLAELGTAADGICKAAVYEGAAIIADAVKENTPVDTGDLRDSIGLSKMKNDNGYINTKLGFDGYDRKGVPNALKAAAIESGTSRLKKKPFVRPAVMANTGRAEAKMAQVVEEMIETTMKG